MEFPLFEPLTSEQRRELLSQAKRRRFARNEVICHEGDPGDTLHLIDKGHVACRRTTPLGEMATLIVLGPGDYFGELAVLSSEPRNSTVVALDSVETLGVHRDVLIEYRRSSPAIDAVLIAALVAEVRHLSQSVLEALFLPVEKRLLRRLDDLVRVFGPDDTGLAVIPLTQDDLAQMAGATRPTVNRVLKAEEEAGYLRVARGRVEVCDAGELRRRSR